ncbi:MAG TPA: single-stranded-DNA-specific exonuclease RecJ [Gammaproteobacteria bacterium]|nr:single-stranded-DNA-specific exonuclease RecJ [Gammaproteobacteria bacterium]
MDVPQLLRKIYAARGVGSTHELSKSLKDLLPLTDLKGVEQAAEILAQAIITGKHILIVADFDADGATSCAVAMRALRLMGASQVSYVVPNRFEYGYGLTPEIVAVAAKQSPDVLVTVDNGISSIEGVAAARTAGIQVVVTDHHLPGKELPAADAIVNPNQPDDSFVSKNLAGVGVIFYTLLAVRGQLREQGWFDAQARKEPNLAELLDLVALGTVADVVPLDSNNRILVEQGIRRIRAGKACLGINALLEVAKRVPAQVVAADLGFAIGPRINAAGRLDDMSLGIECLLSDDPQQARELAIQLDQLNHARREIEGDMREQAMASLDALQLQDKASLALGLCIYDPDWHQGVIGILAARIREQLHRPVIAFARCGDDEIKGSARSIPGLHIRDALDAVASQQPELLSKFGGHAMAAGLSLREQDLPVFQQAFDQEVRRHLGSDDLHEKIQSDGALEVQDLSMQTAQMLRDGGPWGQGFPEPSFDGVFEVVQYRLLAEKHLKMVLRAEHSDICIDAIAFNASQKGWPLQPDNVHLVYRLDINHYRGNSSLQLMVEHMAAI